MKPLEFIYFDGEDCYPEFKRTANCYVIEDCYVVKEAHSIKVMKDGKRFVKYLLRHYFHNIETLTKHLDDLIVEDNGVYDFSNPVNSLDNAFFLYDEWMSNLFIGLYDCYPRVWFYDQLKKQIPDLLLTCPVDDTIVNELLHETHSNQIFELKIGVTHVKKLFVPGIIHMSHGWLDIMPEKYLSVYDRVKDVFTKESYVGEKVYVSRQDVNNTVWFHDRKLLNELELIDRLQNVGYKIVQLLPLSIKDKIAVSRGASKFVTLSGASCACCVFSKPTTKNVFIRHPVMGPWYNNFYEHFRKRYNLNIQYVSDQGQLRYDIPHRNQDAANVPWELKSVDETFRLIESF